MKNKKNKDVMQMNLTIRIFEILERQGLISEEEKNRLKVLIISEYGNKE